MDHSLCENSDMTNQPSKSARLHTITGIITIIITLLLGIYGCVAWIVDLINGPGGAEEVTAALALVYVTAVAIFGLRLLVDLLLVEVRRLRKQH